MNYSTIFTSLKSGITTLIPGTVADVSVTRKGNRMNRVYVNSTVDVPVENQPQITPLGHYMHIQCLRKPALESVTRYPGHRMERNRDAAACLLQFRRGDPLPLFRDRCEAVGGVH